MSVDGAVRFFFRVFGPRRRRLSFRWLTLVALLLVMGQHSRASEGTAAAAWYFAALVLHETAHWLIAGRLFPGLERSIILAPLGGPASAPPTPTFKTISALLAPALILGGIGGGLIWSGAVPAWAEPFAAYLLVISAANLLPFFPLDGHAWLGAIVRKTEMYWRRPAWREYTAMAGGIALAIAGAAWNPLDTGVILVLGGASIVLENAYMLRLRGGVRRERATGIPAAGSVAPDDKARLDAILDKISREGMTALTGDEERFLEEMSGRLRGRV